jgi:hypothetical protein
MVKRRERLLYIATALCIIALVGDRLILSPLAGFWASRSERIGVLHQDIAKAELLLDRETTLRERWGEMQKAGLPGDTSAAEGAFLNAISRWIGESGLTRNSMKPQWVDDEDAEYVKLDCRANGQGSLGSIAKFLYALESDPLGIRVEEFQIDSKGDSVANLDLSVRFSGLIVDKQGAKE